MKSYLALGIDINIFTFEPIGMKGKRRAMRQPQLANWTLSNISRIEN